MAFSGRDRPVQSCKLEYDKHRDRSKQSAWLRWQRPRGKGKQRPERGLSDWALTNVLLSCSHLRGFPVPSEKRPQSLACPPRFCMLMDSVSSANMPSTSLFSLKLKRVASLMLSQVWLVPSTFLGSQSRRWVKCSLSSSPLLPDHFFFLKNTNFH